MRLPAEVQKTYQCLFYALDKLADEGGYLMFGKSLHWNLPHALHMDNQHNITHFVPPDKLKQPWHSLFSFSGCVKTDDDVHRGQMSMLGMFFGTLLLLIFGGVWAVTRMYKKLQRTIWFP